MATLDIESRIARPDGFHERPIEMGRDPSREQGAPVPCEPILLLANPIGDADVLCATPPARAELPKAAA